MATKKKTRKVAKKTTKRKTKKKSATKKKRATSSAKVEVLVTERAKCFAGPMKSFGVKLRRGRDSICLGEIMARTKTDAIKKARAFVKKSL